MQISISRYAAVWRLLARTLPVSCCPIGFFLSVCCEAALSESGGCSSFDRSNSLDSAVCSGKLRSAASPYAARLSMAGRDLPSEPRTRKVGYTRNVIRESAPPCVSLGARHAGASAFPGSDFRQYLRKIQLADERGHQ